MKLKWGNKRFTFVIIPDANGTVRRFEVPKLFPYIAGAGLVALIIGTAVLTVVHTRTTITASQLQSLVASQEQWYGTTVEEKNQTIEQLQSDIIKLSEQTGEMKNKIEDIRKLEEEVRSITGSNRPTAAGDQASSSTAKGGNIRIATQEEVLALLDQTKEQLSGMDKAVVELRSSIATSKEEALAVQQKLRTTPSIWPVDSRRVSSGFGVRQDPFTFRPSFHSGYDIGAPINSNVYVTADGVVQSTGYDTQRGNNILVKHADGLQTWYMHLNKIDVEKGERLEKGQVIGYVGSTGRSTGNHLHYEVLKNGVSIDPKPYLK